MKKIIQKPENFYNLPCEDHFKLLQEALKRIELLEEEMARVKKSRLDRK